MYSGSGSWSQNDFIGIRQSCWWRDKKIPEYHKRVSLEEWIVMPDHLHFILTLNGFGFENGISSIGDEPQPQPTGLQWWHIPDYKPSLDEIKHYRKLRRKMLISKILGKFKHQTSKQINSLRSSPGTRNWQKDYHDTIIRDPASYQYIKTYIANNPAKWGKDKQRETTRGGSKENSWIFSTPSHNKH